MHFGLGAVDSIAEGRREGVAIALQDGGEGGRGVGGFAVTPPWVTVAAMAMAVWWHMGGGACVCARVCLGGGAGGGTFHHWGFGYTREPAAPAHLNRRVGIPGSSCARREHMGVVREGYREQRTR
jgi:hypothetical protein